MPELLQALEAKNITTVAQLIEAFDKAGSPFPPWRVTAMLESADAIVNPERGGLKKTAVILAIKIAGLPLQAAFGRVLAEKGVDPKRVAEIELKYGVSPALATIGSAATNLHGLLKALEDQGIKTVDELVSKLKEDALYKNIAHKTVAEIFEAPQSVLCTTVNSGSVKALPTAIAVLAGIPVEQAYAKQLQTIKDKEAARTEMIRLLKEKADELGLPATTDWDAAVKSLLGATKPRKPRARKEPKPDQPDMQQLAVVAVPVIVPPSAPVVTVTGRLDGHDFAKTNLVALLGALAAKGIETEAALRQALDKTQWGRHVSSVARFCDGHSEIAKKNGDRTPIFTPVAVAIAEIAGIKPISAYADYLKPQGYILPVTASMKPVALEVSTGHLGSDEAVFQQLTTTYPTLGQAIHAKGVSTLPLLLALIPDSYGDKQVYRQRIVELIAAKKPYDPKNGQLLAIAKVLGMALGQDAAELFKEHGKTLAAAATLMAHQRKFGGLIQNYSLNITKSGQRSSTAIGFVQSFESYLRSHGPNSEIANLGTFEGLFSSAILPIESGNLRHEAAFLMHALQIPSAEVVRIIPEISEVLIFTDMVRSEFPNLATLMMRHNLYTTTALNRYVGDGNIKPGAAQSLHASLTAPDRSTLENNPDAVRFLETVFNAPSEVMLAPQKMQLPTKSSTNGHGANGTASPHQ